MASVTVTFETNLDNSPETATALGLLTAEWASLEYRIFGLFCALIGPAGDRRHELICQIMFYNIVSVRTRLETIKSISQLAWPMFSDQINKLMVKVNKAANKRNSFTHDMWMTEQPLNIPVQWRLRSNAYDPEQIVHVPAKDLDQFSKYLRNLAEQIMTLTNEVICYRSSQDNSQNPPLQGA